MDALLPATRILFLVFAALNFKSVSWPLVACSAVVAVLVADLPFARTGNRRLDYMVGAALLHWKPSVSCCWCDPWKNIRDGRGSCVSATIYPEMLLALQDDQLAKGCPMVIQNRP